MSWLLQRIAVTLIAMVVGGVLGMLVAGTAASTSGALLGATIALGGMALRDTLRGYRLITWLRGSQEGQAPRDAGLWGELGYRIERSVRQLEQRAALEREQLTQFLSAIEASPNGVMLLDAGDQIEWCNSHAADHFGLDPQRDRRQRVTNLVRAPTFVSYLQAGRFDDAVQLADPRGQRSLSVLVRSYGDGLKLVLSHDITERERSEAMRRDFVANVSHEIRTPLTVLAGFIETMTNLTLTEPERKRVLVLMMQQADRMGTLVADLLTLAQLEGSPRPNADRWVPLAPLLAQAAIDAKLLSAGRHALTFASNVEAQIAGAPNELLSALTNLVNNAVRYTPSGGRIDVTWKLLADGAGEIAVVDTGLGIAREHLPRLTERFYRVDGSRSRDTGGTGLGLSIVKHVMQRHGGELAIRSEPGQGSTFRLVFPAARVRDVAAAPVEPTLAVGIVREEPALP
ncbi:MAG: phosphate regulon sensor histidine kinase PhoR [Burkholderiales bacterium]|nr:phosphate regulon sensor histidine kinase PhoR [Burkholderiales bacterium]MDE2627658.1 phosphate regulon sensor histidine kinase PhoR [Burkholderiales bacterium]